KTNYYVPCKNCKKSLGEDIPGKSVKCPNCALFMKKSALNKAFIFHITIQMEDKEVELTAFQNTIHAFVHDSGQQNIYLPITTENIQDLQQYLVEYDGNLNFTVNNTKIN